MGGKLDNESYATEEHTFTSSANGARLYCMRVQVYGSFLLVWLIKVTTNGGTTTTEDLSFCMSNVIGYLLIVLLVYHFFPPHKLRMRMTLDGGQVNLVGYARNITVPVSSLRRIEILRSWKGRHRIVRIWDSNGFLYTIVSPAGGQWLEWWAAEFATREGVSVERRVSWYLTLEPVSTFVSALIVGGIVGAPFITNGF